MSLLADGLLRSTQQRAFTEAYSPSTSVAIATSPNKADTPPMHSINLETGFGQKVRTPEQPMMTAPMVREGPGRCAAVLWIRRTGVVLSWVEIPSYEYKSKTKFLQFRWILLTALICTVMYGLWNMKLVQVQYTTSSKFAQHHYRLLVYFL